MNRIPNIHRVSPYTVWQYGIICLIHTQLYRAIKCRGRFTLVSPRASGCARCNQFLWTNYPTYSVQISCSSPSQCHYLNCIYKSQFLHQERRLSDRSFYLRIEELSFLGGGAAHFSHTYVVHVRAGVVFVTQSAPYWPSGDIYGAKFTCSIVPELPTRSQKIY